MVDKYEAKTSVPPPTNTRRWLSLGARGLLTFFLRELFTCEHGQFRAAEFLGSAQNLPRVAVVQSER
jgi:hypothetical protein